MKLILLLSISSCVHGFSIYARGGKHHATTELAVKRRWFIDTVVGTAAIISAGKMNANALDIDSFINNEIKSEVCDPKKDPKCIPKLTEDEALCQYGQSGEARKEACKRVKQSGKNVPKPNQEGKSLGGAYAM